MPATATCGVRRNRRCEGAGEQGCAKFEVHGSAPGGSADSMTLQRKGMLSEDFAEGLKKDE
jgi:hypothetical protein